MSNRARLLEINASLLKQLLRLPESTEITSVHNDAMRSGVLILRIEDECFPEVGEGECIERCSAIYSEVQTPVDESGTNFILEKKFRGYIS